MALLYTDSFETYPTADLGMYWSSVVPPSDFISVGTIVPVSAAARSGSAGLRILKPSVDAGATNGQLEWYAGSRSTLIVGFAYYTTYYTTDRLLSFVDGTTEQIRVYTDTSGNMHLDRNGTTIASVALGGPRLRLNAWNYLELKTTFHATTGSAELRLNGQTVCTFSGNTIVTGNASADHVHWTFQDKVGTIYLDDLYVCDGTGSVNNTFLGDVRVQAIFPAVAGLAQFTASGAASDVLCVKEHAEDGDTTFVYTAGAGVADTYGMDQITGYTGGIPGIYVRSVARKDDAGSRIISPIVVSVTATGVGPQTSLSNTYGPANAVFETDPNTGAAWAMAALNAATIGVSAVQ